jgi:hypothetical protein
MLGHRNSPKRYSRADHQPLNRVDTMTNKPIAVLKAMLLIGAAAVLALSAQATAGMHSNMGHHSMGTHSVSAPPPNMSPPSSGMRTGTMGVNATGTPTGTMGGNNTGMHHHHHHFDDDDDFFFFDPFWYPYPYTTVETRYVEVPASDGYWCYCPDSKSYYPYVKECASKWERVPPRPPTE